MWSPQGGARDKNILSTLLVYVGELNACYRASFRGIAGSVCERVIFLFTNYVMWRQKVFQSLPIQLPHIALFLPLIGQLAKNYNDGANNLSLTANLVMGDSLDILDFCKKTKTYHTSLIQLGNTKIRKCSKNGLVFISIKRKKDHQKMRLKQKAK